MSAASLKPFIGSRVKAYRNLNKPSHFSVKAKGSDGKEKVQGYSTILCLSHVTFTGGHGASQKKIQSGGHREVHAYAVGTLESLPAGFKATTRMVEVTYRPKEREGFFIAKTGQTVTQADLVYLANSKMYCINPR